jgi:RNA polymerase-binding transcription factor DksA
MSTTISANSRADATQLSPGTTDQTRAALLAELHVQHQCVLDADAAIDVLAAGDIEDAAEAVELHARIRARALASAAELEAALARIDSGTYGACERCGDAIPEERLDAIPHARTCVRCSAAY